MSITKDMSKQSLQRGQWSSMSMKKAIEAVTERRLSYRKAEKEYSVPKSTLQRHVKCQKLKEAANKDLSNHSLPTSSGTQCAIIYFILI